MLSCNCDYGDEPAWWHDGAGELTPLATKRMRRCCSCKCRIAVGDECSAIARWRNPGEDSIEYRIYGDEQPLSTWYLCERCDGLLTALDDLGYCGLIGQDLREVCREYAQMQRDAGIFRGQMIVRPILK